MRDGKVLGPGMSGLDDHVDHALSQTRRGEQWGHQGGVEHGGLRGRLDHRGAARRERRCEGAHQQHGRRVPGHDDAGDAGRLAQHGGEHARLRLQHMTGDVAGEARVVEHLRDRSRDLAARLGDRLAVVAGEEFGEVLPIRLQRRRPVEQHLLPKARGAGPRAAIEGAPRRRDRRLSLGAAALGDPADASAVRRVEAVRAQCAAGLAIDPVMRAAVHGRFPALHRGSTAPRASGGRLPAIVGAARRRCRIRMVDGCDQRDCMRVAVRAEPAQAPVTICACSALAAAESSSDSISMKRRAAVLSGCCGWWMMTSWRVMRGATMR